jgi:hypothetical protein
MDKAVQVIVELCKEWAAYLLPSSSYLLPSISFVLIYCNVKFTVTVMITGTGTPFKSVGANCHC